MTPPHAELGKVAYKGSCKPAPASSSTLLPVFQPEPTFLFLVENMSPASLALLPKGPTWEGEGV